MAVRIAFASHVATIDGKQYDGIGNVLKEILPEVVDEYIYVRHSMDGLIRSEIQRLGSDTSIETQKLGVIKRPGIIRYVSEVVSTVRYFSKNPVDVFIGIDPLNALAGSILKKRGKIKKTIFYTPDYSPRRFGNAIVNSIYHRIDRYCVKHSDEVWSVSKKIVSVRKDMGLADEKNKFLPNVPPPKYQYLDKNRHSKYQLVTTGIVDKQMDFGGVIRAISGLRQSFPEISFTIVGNGPAENDLKKLASRLGVADRVHFLGRKTLPETLDIVSRAGVGLALYTGEWSFNEFGDSTKCREFGSYGLPILSTSHHATVDELRESGAGIIVGQGVENYIEGIVAIFENYDEMSRKSSLWGKKYAGIHAKLISSVLKDAEGGW